jgi:serine/threonine protein kinase
MTTKNYYDILEVSPKARPAVIKAAFRALSKEYGDANPDRRFLNEANEVLSDEQKRKDFDASLKPPTGKVVRIGSYRILDEIAEGGFGVTYRAVHEFSGKLVCIKHSLNISPIDEALMLEEAKAVWDLRHWASPAIREIIKLADGSVAIVMSYVPGRNLQQIVDKNGPMDPEHVCWITERVLNALCYLHDNGVIHGDVKPANIIIQPDTHQVVLVDYGLALVRPGKDATNKGFTPMFASPEQRDNKPLLPESDLYSLGLTMIYALGGDPAAGKVPATTPDAVRDFIGRLIVRHILSRPNWSKENLCKTIGDVREKAFGRRASGMKPLKI